MKFVSEPTTHRHRIGECPACRSFLWAEVLLVTEVAEPTITSDGKAHVFATPRFEGMTVTHHCHRDADGDWVTEGEQA